MKPDRLISGPSIGNGWPTETRLAPLLTLRTHQLRASAQTITFSGQVAPFVQTYRYDPLDRITEAIEKVNGTQTWKQTFGYDIYGNRNARYQIVGSNVLPINNVTLPSVVSTTNRFTSGQGYAYDSNGNITGDVDAATGQSRTFTFNGDNKQTEVRNSSNVIIGT